ncbi:response regulator [Halobaculum roseum]|uniref:Response regulator n=1 Tax=Halobaculum roseum TaxID=2175149 RepID=A0ABD5MNA0_9EURY|nr:response regulator [Halobaculum roseum]QZY01668.1 response regulator [Halobaculum roseum]
MTSPGATEPLRVLHAEDDDALAEVVTLALEREAWVDSVVRVPDAEAALAALDREPYDCLLSDLEMPGLSGLELYERVRETHPSLPFVLFTGRPRAVRRGDAPPTYEKGGADALGSLTRGLYRLCVAAGAAVAAPTPGDTSAPARPDAMFYRCRRAPGWPAEVVGPGVTVLLGYEPEAFERGELTYAEDVVHPEDRQWTHDAMEASLSAGDPFEFTYRARRADGDVIRVWERGRGVPGGDAADGDAFVEGFVLPLGGDE